MKLNEKRTPALPAFGVAVACLFGAIVCVVISAANIPLISGLAWLVGIVLSFGFFGSLISGILLGLTNTVHAGQKAVALRTLPNVPSAITSASELFNKDRVPTVDTEMPVMTGKLIDHFENQTALRNHIKYLNDILNRTIETLKPVPERYRADQTKVEAQQLALYRMAHQASVAARKIEARFPKIKADLTSVPPPRAVALPAPPRMASLTNLEKWEKNFNMAAGRILGQSAQNGGLAILIAIVAVGAFSVIGFQKQVRAMQDAHGQLRTFTEGAKGDLEVLGLAHAELVNISRQVRLQSTELSELLMWSRTAVSKGKFSGASVLDACEEARALRIIYYALMARIDAAKAV